MGFKLDIPEFKDFLQPEEFLDWVVAVEEVLLLKDVPLDKRVSLVAMKFRGAPPRSGSNLSKAGFGKANRRLAHEKNC